MATGTVVGQTGRTYVAESILTCGDEQVARGSGALLRTSTPLTDIPGYLENS